MPTRVNWREIEKKKKKARIKKSIRKERKGRQLPPFIMDVRSMGNLQETEYWTTYVGTNGLHVAPNQRSFTIPKERKGMMVAIKKEQGKAQAKDKETAWNS